MNKAEPSGGIDSQVQMEPAENQIVVYQPNETVRLETRYAHESIWLTQLKIAELFGVQKAGISKHLKNIYSTGELSREATVSKMETVQNEGGRTVVTNTIKLSNYGLFTSFKFVVAFRHHLLSYWQRFCRS